MRGCLIKRGKSEVWWAKISLNGRQKWLRVGNVTKHEAERELRKQLDELERNFSRTLHKRTFRELATEWLASQRLDKKPHTISSYSMQIETHLLPHLGGIVVSKILPEDVERFKQEMAGRVSPTTVNYDLRLLRTILDAGIRWGYLYTNPAKLVKKLKQPRKQFQALAREDVLALLEGAEGQGRLFLMVATMTGMRLGELLAMKWQNVNGEIGTYTVKESYSVFGVDSPKTETSFRTVQLLPALLKALREHKVWQNARRLRLGASYHDQGLIFTTETGNYLNPSNVRNRIFYPALKAAGLPKTLRFHDLRGTCATLLLEAGANVKFVQDQLGHKTARITLELYAKVNDVTRRDATEKLQAYLFG